MEDHKYDAEILINDEFRTVTLEEAEALKPIQKQFMESYIAHKDEMTVEEWLPIEMAVQLPEQPKEEIQAISSEIISALKITEEKHHSLKTATCDGRSKEDWFAQETQKWLGTVGGARMPAAYLIELDEAMASANESLRRTLVTKAGLVSRSPHLDGYIAEQYHAQTFNLNAEAAGSPYRARVLEPTGHGYAKNSVDIVIEDEAGKVVKRYQSKYYKDAKSTAKAFEAGDYRGQQKLVPSDQHAEIAKKCTQVIEAPDGITSNPLSKQDAKELQTEAQSGKWSDLNWNEYKAKDLAVGIGKQVGQAAIMGAVVGAGFDIAQKVWDGEELDGEEVVEAALTSGADFGVKAAAAGALTVGVRKEIISIIPKETLPCTIANIAFVAVENVKVLGEVASGELSFEEGLDKMEQVTVSSAAGLIASAKGAGIGIAVGTVFGPVGMAVGGVVGSAVGYMAGSKIGEMAVKTVQKFRKKAKKVIVTVKDYVHETVGKICDRVSSTLDSFASVLGW